MQDEAMNAQEQVTMAVADGVAVLTIRRPEKHNSFTLEMLQRLLSLATHAQSDRDVRVIVLTGEGDEAFSTGGDLTDMLPRIVETGDVSEMNPDPSERFFSAVYKPIIAAVKGLCIGGGVELLLGTDIRIASPDASFSLGEVRWGLIPGGGTHVRLPRQVPWAVAMQMILTGEPITAQRAYEVGLINEIVPAAEVLPRALEVAARIARNGPVAVQTAKEIAVRALRLSDGFQLESDIAPRVLASEQASEGLAAFAEKRRPNFD
jgi:enoyl-CoA hydratase